MYLTKADRQAAIKPILCKLQELHLSPISCESIKLLYQHMQMYIQEGTRIPLNIPFPEYNATIKGLLAPEQVWVKIAGDKPIDL